MKIQSEIAPLKKVLMHRPYLSLQRLTPDNCQAFLFDDVVWPEKLLEEYDQFVTILSQEGVEVFFLEKLLIETLENPAAKAYMIQQILSRYYRGSSAETLLAQYLDHLSPTELVKQVLGGMTFSEIQPYSLGLISKLSKPYDFILPPLPNQLFVRDTSCWIGKGVCINSMTFAARQLETVNIATVYKYHPMFQKEKFQIWYDGSNLSSPLPNIEGGDVLVINAECLLVGIGERTQPRAVEILAKCLFKHNLISKIIALRVPKARSSMHLDTLFTMIDSDIFYSAFPTENFNSWLIRPGETEDDLIIEKQPDFFRTLSAAMGVDKLKILHSRGDFFSVKREQWTDANNLLALKPGVVVSYDRNILTGQKLQKAGITVMTIPGSELSRGRGGPRCMTCPLLREEVTVC